MGKKKKGSSSKKTATRGPSGPPSSKKGGKKRTSAKTGGAMDAITSVMSNIDMSQLPALPSFTQTNSPSAPRIKVGRGGQLSFAAPRRRSRKGLSGSDIKGFLRVHKFAGMMTKVTGTKHRAVPRKKR